MVDQVPPIVHLWEEENAVQFIYAVIFAAIVVYTATVLVCVLSGRGDKVPPRTHLKDALEEITFPLLVVLLIGAVVSWNRGVESDVLFAGLLAGIFGLVLVHISFRLYGRTQKIREDRRERPDRKYVPTQGISPDQARQQSRDRNTPYRMP